jgi:hypothetical protein
MANRNMSEWYLAKAKEADALASQFEDTHLKETWSAIAEGYRELAKVAPLTATPSHRSFRSELP